jgi:hypothetical protein
MLLAAETSAVYKIVLSKKLATFTSNNIWRLEATSSTIDYHVRPIDVTPCSTCKQNTHPIQLTQRTHPSHWVSARPSLPCGLDVPFSSIQDCVHIPGRDTVRPDAVHRPFSSQTGLQSHDARFADIVSDLRLWEIDPMSRDGSYERNAVSSGWPPIALRRPLVLSFHLLRHILSTKERAGGVDVEGLSPLLVRHFERVVAADYTREAEQMVDAAHDLDSRSYCLTDGC